MNRALLLLSLVCMTASSLRGQNLDYKYQSVFIYNFIKSVKWPNEEQSSEFTIGVLANQKVAGLMNTFFTGKTVLAKKIVVKSFASVEDMQYCHALFVPTGGKNNLSAIVQKVGTSPTLLITEKEGWGKQGSVINFVVGEDGKYRFELNQQAAQKYNLKTTTQLQALAILL